MSDYFEDIFDKQQCSFRKGYNTQQCLLKMLEKWETSVDKSLWCTVNRSLQSVWLSWS